MRYSESTGYENCLTSGKVTNSEFSEKSQTATQMAVAAEKYEC
jgi:hypothetical protein